MLERLERANLFIVPLDDERHWYRYHRLFSDLLQHRLRLTESELLPELHRRASQWYEGNGLIAEAVHHALAAQDFWRAAHLVEENSLPTPYAPTRPPCTEMCTAPTSSPARHWSSCLKGTWLYVASLPIRWVACLS